MDILIQLLSMNQVWMLLICILIVLLTISPLFSKIENVTKNNELKLQIDLSAMRFEELLSFIKNENNDEKKIEIAKDLLQRYYPYRCKHRRVIFS